MSVTTQVFSSRQHAEDVKALRKDIALLIRRLGDMTADRNEWRTQHENLLAMYRAECAKHETPAQRFDRTLRNIL